MIYALSTRNFTSFDTRNPLPPPTIYIENILCMIGQHNDSIMDFRIFTDLFHTLVK